jgi:methyl-accepting chemotaxis protein
MRFSQYPIRWRVGVTLGGLALLWSGLAGWQAVEWLGLLQSPSAGDAARVARRALWTLGLGVPVLVVLTAWAARAFTRTLVLPIRYARNCALRLARGDLTVPVERRTVNTRGDEAQELILALQTMYDAFSRVVGRVRDNAEVVAATAELIAVGNRELSDQTEQQAGSLQQTARSMDTLTGNVRDSAHSAAHANELAHQASAVALRGGEITGQLASTMQDIESSAKRIADITGLIDTIAFQTNMLALNAAVEASRAGERGKGFAVVAGEVRQLAQRSAVAAREIKALVDESVTRVASGASLVDSAGVTMQQIVASTRDVSSIIDAITQATRHQTSGIDQVSHAMASMDEATRHNVSWAHSSAQTSETLKEKAFDLVAAVALFQLRR